MAPNLPPGAVPLGWWEEDGATLGLCDIGGVAFIHGLTSAGEDSLSVIRLYKRASELAKARGFDKLYLEASNHKIIETAGRIGFTEVSRIMEKAVR